MSHEGGASGDGMLPDFVSGVVQAAKNGIGAVGDAVGGLVDHVTPDDVNPFGGGGGGSAPDVPGAIASVDPETIATVTDVALQVIP